MDTLKKWNYGAAAIHLTATILAATLLTKKNKREVQMTRLKYKDLITPKESRVDIPVEIEDDVKIDLKYIVVAFFAITSASHFLYATDFFGRGWYSSQVLGFGWNPYRWLEYSLSAGLMIYLISAASGTKDQVSAVSAALITPGLMINGLTTERALRQNALHDWSVKAMNGNPHLKKPEIDSSIIASNLIPAWFLFGVKWYIILSNYSKLAEEAKAAGKPLDASVTFMVYSQLVFFGVFGIIQTYQVSRWFTSRPGRTEPAYIQYEKAYIALSAVAKLFLAGTVAYALRN
jgi:hypothetical protein